MAGQKFNYMMQILNGNANPQMLIKQKIMQNPNIQQRFSQLKNMQQTSGLSEEEFVMQLYKQNGINPDQVKQLQQKMGF